MQVSVIIINYNTKDMTMDCINSVFEKTRDVEFEIILVDNGSVDGSKELFEKDERITYYYLNENLGFGKANNYGIERAKGEYIFCLNSDTLLINNAIFLFYEFAKDKDDVGAIGGILFDKEGNENLYCFCFLTYRPLLNNFYRIYLKKILGKAYIVLRSIFKSSKVDLKDIVKIKNEPFSVEYVSGANMFVRKSLLQKFGAFDPDFFMYEEEAELQYRLTKNGFGSIVYPMAKIIHFEEASSKEKKFVLRKELWHLKSKFLFFKKTLPLPVYYYFRMAYAFLSLPFLFKWNGEERKEYMKVIFASAK